MAQIEEKQSRASKFGDAILWGGGFAIGAAIVGGLIGLGKRAFTNNDETTKSEEDDDDGDD